MYQKRESDFGIFFLMVTALLFCICFET